MHMSELTVQERDFLDKVNKVNRKFCKDEQKSLWNVCKGYLNKVFTDNLLDLPETESKPIFLKINGLEPEKKSVNTLF